MEKVLDWKQLALLTKASSVISKITKSAIIHFEFLKILKNEQHKNIIYSEFFKFIRDCPCPINFREEDIFRILYKMMCTYDQEESFQEILENIVTLY